eukprot:PhF_6_TR43333/c0_g2_i2/m.66265
MPSSPPHIVDSKTFLSAYQHLSESAALPLAVKTYLKEHLSPLNQTLFPTNAPNDEQVGFLLTELKIVHDAVHDRNSDIYPLYSSSVGRQYTESPYLAGQELLDLRAELTRGPIRVFRPEILRDYGLSEPRNHLNIFVRCNNRIINKKTRKSLYPSIDVQISTLGAAFVRDLKLVHLEMKYETKVLLLNYTLRQYEIPNFALMDCEITQKLSGAGSKGNDDNDDGGNDDDGTKVGDPTDDVEPGSNRYVGTVVLKWITRGEISKIMNYLARHVTPVCQDILPLRSAIPIAKTLTFAKQENPGWTVEVILGSPIKEAEIPSGSEEYVAALQATGSRPTPLTSALTGTDGGNVYYGRDDSGTVFYGDFSAEGCNALAEVCKAIVSQPNKTCWFGDVTASGDSQICLPVGICITLSVEETNPWCDVTIVDKKKPQTAQISDLDQEDKISALVAYGYGKEGDNWGGWKAKIHRLKDKGLPTDASYPMYCVTSKHEMLELDMADHKKFLECLDDTARSSLQKYMDYTGRNRLSQLPDNECVPFIREYTQLGDMFQSIKDIVTHNSTPKQLEAVVESASAAPQGPGRKDGDQVKRTVVVGPQINSPMSPSKGPRTKQLVMIGDCSTLLNLLLKESLQLEIDFTFVKVASLSFNLHQTWELEVIGKGLEKGDFSAEGLMKLQSLCRSLSETQPSEIRMVLPAPDSTWDAVTVTTCTSEFVPDRLPAKVNEALQKCKTQPSVVAHVRSSSVRSNRTLNLTLQTLGLHKRIPRCLIDMYNFGEKKCSPDPFTDVTSRICFGKPGDDIYVFLRNQLEEAEEDFIDDQQYATRMTNVSTVAQQITENDELLHVLNTFIIKEAFKLCGVGKTLGEAGYKTLQANCKQGGDFSSPTFSMCLCHLIRNYLLMKYNTEDGETKVEIAACTMIATMWINELKHTVLDALWKDCYREREDCLAEMRKELKAKFQSDSPVLTHSHLKNISLTLSKTLKLKRSETTGDVEDDLEEMLNTEQVRRYESLTLVRDVAKQKHLVKAYRYGGAKFARYVYESITQLNDYCEMEELKPICPLVKQFDRLKSEIHMVYPDQEGWVNLASVEILHREQKLKLQGTLQDVKRILRYVLRVDASNLNPTNFMCCPKTGEIILVDLETAFLAQQSLDPLEKWVGALKTHEEIETLPKPIREAVPSL